jgi:hypothetical protein
MPLAGPDLAHHWWVLLSRGIVAIVACCFAFDFPGLYLGYGLQLGVPIATAVTLAVLLTLDFVIDCVFGVWAGCLADPALRIPLWIDDARGCRHRLSRWDVTKLATDLVRMGAQCLWAHAKVLRQKMRQHVGGDTKRHQRGEMDAQSIQLGRRSTMRWQVTQRSM